MTKHRLLSLLAAMLLAVAGAVAQTITEPTTLYIIHSSGNHLKMGGDGGGYLESAKAARPQTMTIIPDGKGYYSIEATGRQRYLSKSGSWNTAFVEAADQDDAKFSIEQVSTAYVVLRCKGNGLCLGTDGTDAEQKVYSDKNGSDMKHYWFLSDRADAQPRVDTLAYAVSPALVRQVFDGWGVSLCWWANMCGKWTDKKIDEIVRWMVSPTGLNYSHFRYNIGGGDDPENRHCTLHHMGGGKGLRAEMEGFKDFSGDDYHWERDAAQRKIMLKIKELRPDAVFEAFSNSPPYYMTYSGCVSGSTDGGKDNLKPEYYDEFAHYLVDVCRHYKDEYGIEFKTLEPFNESVTNFWFANGVQEGCHFDYSSQVAFVRKLEPILKAAGLNTVISASDETNVGLAVEGFRQFKNAGMLTKIGQWNTHTYSGSIADRAHMAFLAHQSRVPLWMSEVGAGGSGIGGNLSLAQKLIDDMRYLQPETWIDWQYIEEANDQWCTVRGNFAAQTYYKVKNYYVRQHFSRFMPHGSRIVTALCNQSLAAMNATQDTLIVVALNAGSRTVHRIDLSQFAEVDAATIVAYLTSESQNLARVRNYSLNGSQLQVTLTDQSISTLLIPCRPLTAAPAETPATGVSAGQALRTDCDYLIVPRHETTRALTADAQGKVTLQDINQGNADGQQWRLTTDGAGALTTFTLVNGRGQRLTSHRATGSSSLTASTTASTEQAFTIEAVDWPYCRITPARYTRYALDLSNAATNAGTAICTWEYEANDIPTHRQWMLFPLTRPATDGISPLPVVAGSKDAADGIYDTAGRCLLRGTVSDGRRPALPAGVYILRKQGIATKLYIR